MIIIIIVNIINTTIILLIIIVPRVRSLAKERNESALDEGAMCEVLVDGHFGYAATADLSSAGLQRAFDRAMATTRATSPHKVHRFDVGQRPRATGSKSPHVAGQEAAAASPHL